VLQAEKSSASSITLDATTFLMYNITVSFASHVITDYRSQKSANIGHRKAPFSTTSKE
jgi:hypothetical protein